MVSSTAVTCTQCIYVIGLCLECFVGPGLERYGWPEDVADMYRLAMQRSCSVVQSILQFPPTENLNVLLPVCLNLFIVKLLNATLGGGCHKIY